MAPVHCTVVHLPALHWYSQQCSQCLITGHYSGEEAGQTGARGHVITGAWGGVEAGKEKTVNWRGGGGVTQGIETGKKGKLEWEGGARGRRR